MNLNRRTAISTGCSMALATVGLAKGKPVARRPKRIVFICSSLGFLDQHFYPKSEQDLCSSRYLRDWSDLRNDFSVFSGLSHHGLLGSLHRGEQCFLSAEPGAASFNFKNTVSIDQLLRRQVGLKTRVPSLNLSLGDKGICYNEAGTMLPPTTDDVQLYDTLFNKASDAERRAQRDTLKAQLALLDSYRIDNPAASGLTDYVTNRDGLVTSLKAELDWLDVTPPSVSEKLPFPNAAQPALMQRFKNFLICTRLALATDQTRVAVLHIPFYNKVPSAIKGVDTAWHRLTHSAGKSPLVQLATIESIVMNEVGTFLKQLKATQMPHGGNLLDDTIVLVGSNMGNAANHDSRNLPIIVAGGGFDHGKHHHFDRNHNVALSELFLSLTRQLGDVSLPTFKGVDKCLDGFA